MIGVLDAVMDIDLIARRLRSFIDCNRLDQARVIVLDVADTGTDGPASHLVRWIGREHGLELARIGRLLSEPGGPRLRAEDHWHPIVKLRAQLVRRTGDDSETPHPFAGG
jgi:hypothetical protein